MHYHGRAAAIETGLGAFSPTIVLPEQMDPGSRMQASPEQRLLIAILEDAVYCFQKYYHARNTAGRRLFRDAERWLMTESGHPFSFEYICFVLGLDPSAVRHGLERKQAEKPERASATGHVNSEEQVTGARSGVCARIPQPGD